MLLILISFYTWILTAESDDGLLSNICCLLLPNSLLYVKKKCNFLGLPQCPVNSTAFNNQVNNCNPLVPESCPVNYMCYSHSVDDQLFTQCCSRPEENNNTDDNNLKPDNRFGNCTANRRPFIHPLEGKPILCIVGDLWSCPIGFRCDSKIESKIGNCCEYNVTDTYF